jgi:hypothetical protein
MAKSDDNVTFSKAEVEALKLIVADWLAEELVVPPFEPKTEAILKKLGFEISKRERAGTTTQDVASERAATRPETLGRRVPQRRATRLPASRQRKRV